MHAWFAGVIVVAALADVAPSCGSKHHHDRDEAAIQAAAAARSADEMCTCADHKDRACGSEAAARYQAPTNGPLSPDERASIAKDDARYRACADRLGLGSGSAAGSAAGSGSGSGA